jgi:hypothetical protein
LSREQLLREAYRETLKVLEGAGEEGIVPGVDQIQAQLKVLCPHSTESVDLLRRLLKRFGLPFRTLKESERRTLQVRKAYLEYREVYGESPSLARLKWFLKKSNVDLSEKEIVNAQYSISARISMKNVPRLSTSWLA